MSPFRVTWRHSPPYCCPSPAGCGPLPAMASGYEAAVTGHRHHELLSPSGPWETDDHGGHSAEDLLHDLASPGEPSTLSLWGDEPVLMMAPHSRVDLDGLLGGGYGPYPPLPTTALDQAPQSPGPSQAVAWRCLTCPASAQSGCTRCVGRLGERKRENPLSPPADRHAPRRKASTPGVRVPVHDSRITRVCVHSWAVGTENGTRCSQTTPLVGISHPRVLPSPSCTAPPSAADVDDYQLVGDPGQKNGEVCPCGRVRVSSTCGARTLTLLRAETAAQRPGRQC